MPNPYEDMAIKPKQEAETNPYQSMAIKPEKQDSNPYKAMALENKAGAGSRLTNDEYNEAKGDKRGTVGSFLSGGKQGFAEYGASINKLIGSKQGQEYWENLKAKEQVKTEDHPWARLGGEIILDPLNLTPMGVATKANKVRKIANAVKTGSKASTKARNLIAKNLKMARKNGTATKLAYMTETKGSKANRIIKSATAGTAIGAGTQAFKNYGDSTKTSSEKLREIGVSSAVVGVLNGAIAGLTKGKITNAIKGVSDLSSDDAKKGVEAVIANPKAFGLSEKQVEEVKAIKQNYHDVAPQHRREVTRPELSDPKPTLPDWIPGKVNNPPVPYDPMVQTKIDNPILNHPRAKEAIDMARDRYAKQTYNDRVGGDTSTWMDNANTYTGENQYHRVGMKGDKNPHAGFSLSKADVAKIDKGEITPEIEAKILDDSNRLEADPMWRDNRTTDISHDIKNQAEELHAEYLAEQEGKPQDMSMDDWNEAKTMFANGGGNAFGGAMGGGTLGGADAAYDDIVEGKDVSTEDYLARIAGGAAIGAGLGYKFGGKGEGAGLFAGQKAKGFKDAKNIHKGKYDGQDRFEIDDSGMQLHKPSFQKMSEGQSVKLSEVIDHPEAFKNYPELKDINVKFDSKMQGNASFDGENTITLSTRLSEEDARSGLVHEMQHAIQSKEGFAGGGSYSDMLREVEGRIYTLEKKGDLSPLDAMNYKEELDALKSDPSKEAFERYKKVAGEIEAREVQARQDLTPQERELIPAYENTNSMSTGNHSDEAYNSAFMAELEGRHKDFDSVGIDPEDATLDFSRSKSDEVTIPTKDKSKRFDHLKGIVEEETLQDWKDASHTLRNMFTDSLGSEYHKARESVTAATNGASVKIERLQKVISDLSEKDRTDLHDYMVDEGTELSPQLEPFAKMIKDEIQDLGKQMVEGKVLSQEAYDEWAGHYIHRSYEKHLLKDVKSLMKKGFTIDEIHRRGKIEEFSRDEAQAMINSGEIDPALLKLPLKDGGIRFNDLGNGKFELTRDWTKAEREAMGEVRDGAVTIPDTVMRMKRMVDNANFLKEVEGMDSVVMRDSSHLTDDEIKKAGFIKVGNNPRFGALSGKTIRKDVYDDIVAMNDEIFNTFHGADGALGRVWKGYLSVWKKSKTVWNFPSHVNNFASNLFLMHLSGMRGDEVLMSVAKASKMMYKEKHYEALLERKMKGQASIEEIAELSEVGKELKYLIEAKETGLLGRSQLNDITGGQQNAIKKRGALSKLDKISQDWYHNGDAVNRIAMYTHLRDKMGLDADEARKMVLSVMPDYSKPMPKGYRILRDTGISPFISWSYYTMPTILKMMKTKQGAKQMAKVVGVISAMEYMLTDGEVKPWDNLPFVEGNKPESFKGRRFAVGKDGSKISTIKMDRWIPYLELQDPVNFAMSQIGGPTVKAATNLGTVMSKNGMVDTYSGRGVTNQNKPLGQRVYDNTKYLTQNYVPLPAQAYSGYDFIESMVRDKKKRRKNSVADPRTTNQSVAKLLGLNTLTFDKNNLKREQRKK